MLEIETEGGHYHMQPLLFAEIDWQSTFVIGLIAGGGALLLLALVFFFRAMAASREDAKSIEANQPMHMAALLLGIGLVVGGLYFRGSLTSSNGEGSASMSSFHEFVSKDGRFKASFP